MYNTQKPKNSRSCAVNTDQYDRRHPGNNSFDPNYPSPNGTNLRNPEYTGNVNTGISNVEYNPGELKGQRPVREQYDAAFNENEHPRLLNAMQKWSDENPLERDMVSYKTIIRKKKIWMSNLNRQIATDIPASFSVELQDNTKNIRHVKVVQVTIKYTPVSTPVLNGFVYFPDLGKAETTVNNNSYHAYFPIVQGPIGTPVLFNYNFNDTYITENINLDKVKNRLRVRIMKESSSGEITEFVELNQVAVELELNYVDHAYKMDSQALPY